MKTDIKTFVAFSVTIALVAFCFISAIVVYRSARNGVASTFAGRMAGLGIASCALSDISELDSILKLNSEEAKKSPLYLKYHTALERAGKHADSTFFYFFKYGQEDDLTYIVDGADIDNPEWAPPDAGEHLVDEDLMLGLLHSYRGEGGASNIVDTHEWGLMRTGTYPMCDAGERSNYMAGVDVAIGEILARTALVMTKLALAFILIFGLSLAVCAAFSKRISTRIAGIKRRVLEICLHGKSADVKNIGFAEEEIEGIVSKYAGDSRIKLDNIGKIEREISPINAVCRLRSELKSRANSIVFRNDDLCRYCAAITEHFIFAWRLFDKSSIVENLLKNLVICEGISSGDFEKIAADMCEDFYKFDSANGVKLSKNTGALACEIFLDSAGEKTITIRFSDGVNGSKILKK